MCDSAVCRDASRARLEAAVYGIAYPELSTRAQSAISTAVDLLALPDYFNSPADPWQRLARAFALQTERLAKELADGRITPQRWRADMDTLILLRHIEAHEIGQAAAGIKPIPSRAATAGKVIRDFESFYLQGFFEDIVQGRMNDSAGALSLPRVQARARMYVLKTRATQAQGFVDGSPQEASFDWRLGAVEDHCEECPYIASQGPYYQQTLYTHPGEGDTFCLVNCKCFLVRDDGAVSALPFGVNT